MKVKRYSTQRLQRHLVQLSQEVGFARWTPQLEASCVVTGEFEIWGTLMSRAILESSLLTNAVRAEPLERHVVVEVGLFVDRK